MTAQNIIAAAGNGINAFNYGIGDVTVNVGFNISIQALTAATSASGKSPYGVGALNAGTGDIVVTTSSGDTISSGSSGINTVNTASAIPGSAAALVMVSAAGSIHSGTITTNGGAQPAGIGAGFLGGANSTANTNVNGTVVVNNAANVAADAGWGIEAYNLGNGDVTVNDASGTTVSGATYGIAAYAESKGTGDVAINISANATINSTSNYDVFGYNNGVGNISIVTNAGDVINSGSVGIDAAQDATAIPVSANSSIVVTANGSINSGTNPTGTGSPPGGIIAGYLAGDTIPSVFPQTAVNGDVYVNNLANIVAAAGDGIRAFTFGIGDVDVNDLAGTITALGGASPTNGYGLGISASNSGSGDVHVSTAAGTVIRSGSSGIAAVNKTVSNGSFTVSDSDVSVMAYGSIYSGTILTGAGDPPAGILAAFDPNNTNAVDDHVHIDVLVDNYASIFASAGTDGIRGANYGSGTVTIIAEAGAFVSGGRYGIAALSYDGGDVSVTNYGTVTGSIAAVDAMTTGAATVNIDNFGHLIGDVLAYDVSFTNEQHADWSLNGANTFTGANAFVNLGIIDSTGTSQISGLSAMTNTGIIEVLSGSLELTGSVIGGGIANIYSAKLQFDSASDAHVNFAGTAGGTLVLNDASHFTGTVTGLAYGDTIDLVGISPASVSVSSSGPLQVNYGTGSFALVSHYDPAGFVVESDGNGGTNIVWNHQAPDILTDQLSIVQNANGTTTVLGLEVSDADAAASVETFTMAATTATSGSSVVPSISSGSLTAVNNVLSSGVTYNPGSTAPLTDKIALTVSDSFGASDTVTFVFNEVGTGPNTSLQGTAGKDVILATNGQDVLTGGGGQDQFVFAPTSSGPTVQHTITDFVAGLDEIDVRQFGNISSAPVGVQQGSDTLVTLDSHDTLLLKGVVATALQASDFILHS